MGRLTRRLDFWRGWLMAGAAGWQVGWVDPARLGTTTELVTAGACKGMSVCIKIGMSRSCMYFMLII